jgi:phage tail protein X
MIMMRDDQVDYIDASCYRGYAVTQLMILPS